MDFDERDRPRYGYITQHRLNSLTSLEVSKDEEEGEEEEEEKRTKKSVNEAKNQDTWYSCRFKVRVPL